jgi:secreted Zn-dependent insulinase-like peptidase
MQPALSFLVIAAPLFTESATEREMHAVDSENSKNLTDDGRR